jgi:RNA polymerase sigma-70 factor (ECF subfamily)
VNLLKEDATYSMPPRREWYRGRSAIEKFFRAVWPSYRGFRIRPIGVSGQPGYALYTRAETPGHWNAHSIQVLSVRDAGIVSLTMFMKPLSSTLFPAFKLPLALTD